MSAETLETFTNVPVLAFGLSRAGARCVLRTLSDFGVHLRIVESPEEVVIQLAEAPESLVLVGWGNVPAALPVFPMGENSNLSALVSVCPHRDYKGCFTQALTKRYPSPEPICESSYRWKR